MCYVSQVEDLILAIVCAVQRLSKLSYAHRNTLLRLILLVLACSVCCVLISLAPTAAQSGASCCLLAAVSWDIQIRGRPDERA